MLWCNQQLLHCRENVSSTENLANHSMLVKQWILEENLQPQLYSTQL